MYYLRTRPAANAIQFTVDKTRLQAKNKTSPPARRDIFPVAAKSGADSEAALLCSLENKENCLMCSSWEHVLLLPQELLDAAVYTEYSSPGFYFLFICVYNVVLVEL